MDFRTEKDSIGSKNIDNSTYYGINTLRALENFNINSQKTNINLIKNIVLIKKACAIVNKNLNKIEENKANAIIEACKNILDGNYLNEFNISSLQGGAGTSTNMNVNEVVANIALELLDRKKGDYEFLHPLNHVNLSQSTNDVYPTALKITCINYIRLLSSHLADLQEELQKKENEYANILKLGRTQLMDAVPMMVGQSFGAYAKAISRDRWRIYKVEERLRQINMGATAIGTGLNAENKYIYMITDELQKLSGLGLSRSDFLIDNTQNLDVFVEASGLLKACATNLLKISNDLRLLNSGPKGGFNEIILDSVQAGSSIMPGKVNPVICEMIGQISIKVISNDLSITTASSMGQLELNAFTPLIANSILESLEILIDGVKIFEEKCIKTLKVNKEKCLSNLENSTAYVTALVTHIGYDKASYIAKKSLEENKTIKEIVLEENILDKESLDNILNPLQITKPGIPGK